MSPNSPIYSPNSPSYNQTGKAYSPGVVKYSVSPNSPTYSPVSGGYNPSSPLKGSSLSNPMAAYSPKEMSSQSS